MQHHYAVVLAGGKGTRLWPLSRATKPKQVVQLPLHRTATLLQQTLKRIKRVFPLKHIIISTTRQHFRTIRQQLKEIPSENYCIEEEARGTGVAIGLAAFSIAKRDPKAILVTINSDAYVRDVERYCEVITGALRIVHSYPERLVLVGVPPRSVEGGLGYIVAGNTLSLTNRLGNRFPVYAVKRFVEKPSRRAVQQMMKQERVFWNPTLIAATCSTLLHHYQTFLPGLWKCFQGIVEARDADRPRAALHQLFKSMPSSSIDYDILEHERDLIVVDSGDIGWADIGQWGTVLEILNERHGTKPLGFGPSVDHGSRSILVYNTTNMLVTTVKLNNIVIVVAGGVVLVVHKRYAGEVKTMVRLLDEQGLHQYTK